jgi:hypothetical protein
MKGLAILRLDRDAPFVRLIARMQVLSSRASALSMSPVAAPRAST